mgnify:CR=1 FL=1
MGKMHSDNGRVGAWLSVAICVALAGCAVDNAVDGEAPLALSVKALSAACGGVPGANPFSEISSYELVVHDQDGKLRGRLSASKSGNSLTIDKVPAGSGMQLTLIGKVGGKAKWFARRSGQKIVKNTTTPFDLTLMSVESFTCVEPSSGQATNVLFPSVTAIAGGRVLITGGFRTSKTTGDETILSAPSDEAWIFDPNTGELRKPTNNTRLAKPRAAHSAIFLPKSNRVLIVGGAEKMTVDAKKGGPPTWRVSDGVGITYEIFDVASETFISPESSTLTHAVKRVFPNLMALSDDYVVALGGAQWPAPTVASGGDLTTYMNSSLYDPTAGENGAFISVGASLPLNTPRGGAALAFLGTTQTGGSKYLVWGGDSETDTLHAEVFSESPTAGDGLFNAGYVVSGDITSIDGGLYFPTLTPIGSGKDGKDPTVQFLSVGGVRHHKGAWAPPRAEDVYVVTVNEAKKRITTKRIGGLGAGVYMHSASLTDNKHVLISGGFSAWGTPASFTLRVYDIAKGTFSTPTASASFIKRGGHAAQLLNNDCVFLFGGVTAMSDLEGSAQPVASDIYCPEHLIP